MIATSEPGIFFKAESRDELLMRWVREGHNPMSATLLMPTKALQRSI